MSYRSAFLSSSGQSRLGLQYTRLSQFRCAGRHMFLRPAEHQRLCVDCHGMETLWRFLYYHKEHRNPYLERNVNPLSPRKEQLMIAQLSPKALEVNEFT